ncbi:hypothetical protein WR25_25959 [Diploscapter pachys]|uniref:Uncharacterized protein n=1 Tax=Diploscapter pachys TaxID=2018661 RepID=A0A2A2KSG7_9BILA|nr:hypothetical protein WR25_25959 [Diploscapter pachys]
MDGAGGAENGSAARAETSLVIQPDWNESVRAGNGNTFYIGYRKKAEDEGKTKFLDARVQSSGAVRLEDECEQMQFSVDQHGRLRVVDPSTHLDTQFICPYSVMLTPTSIAALSIDISPSGNLLAVGDSEGSLLVLSTHNMSVQASIPPFPISSTLMYIDNQFFLFQRQLEGHTLDVSVCRFFPSGLVLLSGGVDLQLRVWSVETATCVRELKGHTQAISDLCIIEEGKTVMSCSRDGTAIRWVCGTSEVLFRHNFELGPCTSLSLSSDCSKVLVTCELGCGVLTAEGKEMFTMRSKEPLSTGCFSLDGQNVFVSSERFIQQVNIESRKTISTLMINRGIARRIVDREEGLFAAFSDGSVACYDMRDTTRVSPLFEFTGADSDPIYDMAFHGKSLYTACRDKSIRIYRIP